MFRCLVQVFGVLGVWLGEWKGRGVEDEWVGLGGGICLGSCDTDFG